MREPTRTPGPWETAVVPFEGTTYIAVIQTDSKTEDGCKAVALTGKAGASDEFESLLNADLIAAAPDLLASCEALLSHEDMEESCYSVGFWEILQTARAAIAKAKGGAA